MDYYGGDQNDPYGDDEQSPYEREAMLRRLNPSADNADPPGNTPPPAAPPPDQPTTPTVYKIHEGRDADLNDPNDAWHAFLSTGQYAVPKSLQESQALAQQYNTWGKANGGWTANVGGGSGDFWSFDNGRGVRDSADVISNIGGPGSGFWYGNSAKFPTGGFAQAAPAPAAPAPAQSSLAPAAPAADPSSPTSTPSIENKIREQWLRQSQQGTAVDRNDPTFRQQVDPFIANQDRMRRQYESEAAERLSAKGVGSSGQMDAERRLGAERAGQASGMFESALVTKELENRRDEIQSALVNLKDLISADQARDLQRELAQLSAAISREQMTQQGNQFGQRLAQEGNQFNQAQALDWSKFDWLTNPMNPANMPDEDY